jgi:hypothetical protein
VTQVSTIIIATVAIIAGWLACMVLNRFCYRKLFGGGLEIDFVVLLGPIGTIMIALGAALMGLLATAALCAGSLRTCSNLTLLAIAIVIPWIGASTANFVWYERVMGRTGPRDMARDYIVSLGPLGSVTLLMCAALKLLLGATRAIEERIHH